jgi:cellulose synthase/poly-beta-1,6-N-acetylglucosamine synthase-like glycosyltransferase
MILFWYAVLTTIFWIVISIYLQINRPKIKFLSELPDLPSNPEPAVAIIIAVRNEEADLQQALQSVCQLNYPNSRIVVVNDRSTDRTPEIIREFSRLYPKISVLNIEKLPPGWLGKNHALFSGYAATAEEWMLFTDADVVFAPDTLHKAMGYALQHRLDFLTMLPEIKSRSAVLVSVMATFKLMLELKLRPWDARKPKSIAYFGVGAFNLVKRQAYEQAGTHRPIALRPDDDLKLGELLKKAGFRLDVVYGDKQIELEWYTGIGEFIKGLMKNTFAVSNYSLLFALGAALATMAAFVLPFPLLVLLGNAPERWMALIIFLFQLPLYLPRKSMAGKWWDVLMVPVAGLLIVYVILKSTYLTLKQGGIYWRDTFYPLSELRKNK